MFKCQWQQKPGWQAVFPASSALSAAPGWLAVLRARSAAPCWRKVMKQIRIRESKAVALKQIAMHGSSRLYPCDVNYLLYASILGSGMAIYL